MELPPDQDASTFVELIERVRDGDDAAITHLWENYFQQLVRVAAKRLPANLRRAGDEEDIALSAFHSFIAGVRDQRFPDLQGPDNLWGLLITLTGRKVNAHLRRQTRQKRGGGKLRGESVFMRPSGQPQGMGIDGVAGQSPTPELRAELAEACDELLDQLGDESLKQIAVMRMDGYLVDEIAARMELSKRAVERRLHLIRQIWTEQAELTSRE
jgi:RNA polymerase sigma factor (sigma-70 family)